MQSIAWDKSPIKVGGMYRDVPLDAYHGASICDGPSVSSTGLRAIYNESAAHYFDRSPYNPDPVEDEEKEWQIRGSAAHHLLIGGVGQFAEKYIIRPDFIAGAKFDRRRTVCQDWERDNDPKKTGKTNLTSADIEAIKGMALSLGRHPLIANGGLLDGQIERSLFWLDAETGVWCKSRPDAIPNAGGDVADLKTTPSVLWPDIVRSLDKFGYCQQGALIADGFKVVLDIEVTAFVLIFVEKKRPYCVRVVPVHPDDIERGRRMNRVAIRRFADCWNSGNWPGPGEDDFNYVRLSDAARERIDKRLSFELDPREPPREAAA
jgi:hypothetical protein